MPLILQTSADATVTLAQGEHGSLSISIASDDGTVKTATLGQPHIEQLIRLLRIGWGGLLAVTV